MNDKETSSVKEQNPPKPSPQVLTDSPVASPDLSLSAAGPANPQASGGWPLGRDSPSVELAGLGPFCHSFHTAECWVDVFSTENQTWHLNQELCLFDL